MALSLSELRTAVSTQILNLSEFHLSRLPGQFFGRQQNTLAHKSFAVEIASTSKMNERQRRTVGVFVESSVNVIFAYRLRPKDVYPTDYDLALDVEKDVINQALKSYLGIKNEIEIRYNSSTRTITESLEYMIITCAFVALHTLPTN